MVRIRSVSWKEINEAVRTRHATDGPDVEAGLDRLEAAAGRSADARRVIGIGRQMHSALRSGEFVREKLATA
jgi:hypothetical protein